MLQVFEGLKPCYLLDPIVINNEGLKLYQMPDILYFLNGPTITSIRFAVKVRAVNILLASRPEILVI